MGMTELGVGLVVLIIIVLAQWLYNHSQNYIIETQKDIIKQKDITIELKDETIKMQSEWLDQYHRDVMKGQDETIGR